MSVNRSDLEFATWPGQPFFDSPLPPILHLNKGFNHLQN